MSKNKNTNLQLFLDYILALLGWIFILCFLYVSFIRERLPKEIPLMLTEYTFYILLYICIIYLLVLKALFLPAKSPTIFYTLLQILAKPFATFDAIMKYNKYIYPYYNVLLHRTIQNISNWDQFQIGMAYYVFNIIPRSILLAIFLVDVFWLHHLQVFYYFIILGLVPIIYRYLVYTLEAAYKYHIQRLENTYEYVWILEENYNPYDFIPNPRAIHHDTKVSVQRYIEIQGESILTYGDNEEYIDYDGIPFPTDSTYKEYCEKHKIAEDVLDSKDFVKIKEYFYYQYPIMLDFYLSLNSNKNITSMYNIPKVTLVIYLMYFLTWLYILLVSFHTIKDFNITINIINSLIEYYPKSDPYSNINFLFEVKDYPWNNILWAALNTKIVKLVIIILLGYTSKQQQEKKEQ